MVVVSIMVWFYHCSHPCGGCKYYGLVLPLLSSICVQNESETSLDLNCEGCLKYDKFDIDSGSLVPFAFMNC